MQKAGGIRAKDERGGKGGKIPKINNPAGIPKNAITLDEYMALKGVADAMSGYSIDKLRGNKQFGLYGRGRDKLEKEVLASSDAYQKRREQARAEYKSLVESGKIRDKTPLEKRIVAAHGHPDNASTQAARRLLEKQNIDWKTGKKSTGKWNYPGEVQRTNTLAKAVNNAKTGKQALSAYKGLKQHEKTLSALISQNESIGDANVLMTERRKTRQLMKKLISKEIL